MIALDKVSEGWCGHGSGCGPPTLPCIVDLRLLVHDGDSAPVIEGGGQVRGQWASLLRGVVQVGAGEAMFGV